jgi:serine/threonine-protein kinase
LDRPKDYQSGETVPGTVYRVVRLIGAGGMGTVYDVEDTTVGKRYVLKTLHPQLHKRQDLAQRMVKEARQLARLSHPNIVEVVTAGETTDELKLPFYVMEKLNGQSLHTVLQKKGSLELPHALHIGIDLLDALDNAHDKGVVHRDVKPDNIFLHISPNGQTTTKLLDFGIMRVLDEPGVTAGRFMGTLRYAAPEQLRGEAPVPQTDLYAAGLVLYEMVAGRGPFDDLGDSNKIAAAHLSTTPPPLAHWGVEVPASLESLLRTALSKEAQKRPKDAFTFASQLRTLNRILAAERPKSSATSRPTEVPVLGPESAAPSAPSGVAPASAAASAGPATPAPVASAMALAATEHAATRAATPEANSPASRAVTTAGPTVPGAPGRTTLGLAGAALSASATGAADPPTERAPPPIDRSAATHTSPARVPSGSARGGESLTEPLSYAAAPIAAAAGGWRAPATLRMSSAPPRDADMSSDLLARLPPADGPVGTTDDAASATVAPRTKKARPLLGVALGVGLTAIMFGTVSLGVMGIRSRWSATEPRPAPTAASVPAAASPAIQEIPTPPAVAAPTIPPPLDLPPASASAQVASAVPAAPPAVASPTEPIRPRTLPQRTATPMAPPAAPTQAPAKHRLPGSGL